MLSTLSPWFVALYLITVLSLIGVVLSENRNPLKALAWVLVIGFVPFLGLLIYILFGQDQRRRHIISKRVYRRINLKPKIASVIWTDKVDYDTPHWQTLKDLIKTNADSPVLISDDVSIYHEGRKMFASLFDDIRNARRHIHIESYIFEEDTLFNELVELLLKKVEQGVKVRLIYDHVGSWGVRKKTWNKLRKAGIQAYPYMPVVFPLFSNSVNYRNHRKITVIDGIVAYIGGMNIAERYRGQENASKVWCDSHFRITGPAVAGIQSTFLVDWYVVSRRVINIDSSFSDEWTPSIFNPNGIKIQFLAGGPISKWRTIDQAFTTAIARASKYIYIQTPYFLPTETLGNALIAAALSGIDVWIMLPEKNDSVVAGLACESYYGNLLAAGVHVVLYKPGFLHSKLMMIDGEICSIGSANMDFRSLEHNFEFNAIIYDVNITHQLDELFMADLAECREISLEEWKNRPMKRKALNSLVRIFSPLL
ncbi:cardiolipin synthetase [Porphyromonas macacae]|uniref:Cardiolipin synthase n=1 Tax=Porphyromonas macacae TaxID=28115 RepID=A0A0A2EFS6_9PORP|nr:cardiolipin synthase [Porphyromonas macacae]KGN76320.1 cardiolipin synthetase [Porphyromonas macacae]SUB89493.1 Cardiolipin synthase [Porphyromonas macacae]